MDFKNREKSPWEITERWAMPNIKDIKQHSGESRTYFDVLLSHEVCALSSEMSPAHHFLNGCQGYQNLNLGLPYIQFLSNYASLHVYLVLCLYNKVHNCSAERPTIGKCSNILSLKYFYLLYLKVSVEFAFHPDWQTVSRFWCFDIEAHCITT